MITINDKQKSFTLNNINKQPTVRLKMSPYITVSIHALCSFEFCCQGPTKSLVKTMGVDFVFTPSQSQQQQQQPHQKMLLAGNLGS